MSGILDPTVAWLTARQLFVRRRLIAAAIVSLVPAIIALIFRATHAAGADSSEFVTELYRDIVLGTLLPLVAVVFGSASFGGEIEDGTIVYLLVKPLPRWRIVLSKYVVSVVATVAVMIPAIVLPWLVMGAGAVGAERLLGFGAAIVIGAAIYSALFVMLGLTTKRGLVAGLLYVVVIEFVLSRQVQGVRSLSVREFMLTIAGTVAPKTIGVTPDNVSLATVWVMGGIFLVASLAQSIRWLRKYEMAERL